MVFTMFHACFSTHTISMLMYSAYTYQHLIHRNCMLFKTKKIYMQLGFFSSFPISEKQHAYTNIILTKLHVTQPRNNHANWIFFSRFSAQKNNMHILTLSSQKLHVTPPRNNHANWNFFFHIYSSEKQHAYTNIILKKTACYSTKK